MNMKTNTLIMTEPKFIGMLRVISGGQTGADRGGIDAAYEFGVETGGHAPKDFRTSRGNDVSLAKLGLVEDLSFAYPPRTKRNVQNSDGTVIIGTRMDSPGSVLTASLCATHGKPCKQIGFTADYTNDEVLKEAKKLAAWIRKRKIVVLNVAGNRDGFADYTHHHLTFKLIQATLLDLYSTGDLLAHSVQ